MIQYFKRFLFVIVFLGFLVIDTEQDLDESALPYLFGLEWIVITLKVVIVSATVYAFYYAPPLTVV